MNIGKIPFSMEGSYLAVSELPARIFGFENEAGLYLRTVHGTGYMPGLTMMRSLPFCARIIPVFGEHAADYRVEAKPWEVRIWTEHGSAGICFADPGMLLIRSRGIGIDLRLPEGNFLQKLVCDFVPYIRMNCRKNDRCLAVRCQGGNLETEEGREARILARPEGGELVLVIEDIGEGWLPGKEVPAYETCPQKIQKRIDTFGAWLPQVPEEYGKAWREAVYVDWVSMVRREGALTQDTMLMSKNHMCNVWSWDHCFNAVALSCGNPALAWEQWILPFDYQDAAGALPDSVSDAYVARAFVKPPIHGWALSKMMEHMRLTGEQCREAYEKLEKWTMWWIRYRDSDGDGICEYAHGHDSGWDNATAFIQDQNMELPDLAAFLILQMETLAVLADELNRGQAASVWRKRAEKMLAGMTEHCFDRGRPMALQSRTHREIITDSLILYLPILLGKRLPKEVLAFLIGELKSERFCTEYGFATEAVASSFYDADGYWRGPVWAPATLFLTEGLHRAGEEEFARRIARKFCNMAAHSGFAENFDARTGIGLRDQAYTWTASIFMILAKEYLS